MIPKVIHYCWFGGKPLPRSARRCIASWRKFFPDYEIREWNEANFDVNEIPYTREACKYGKYAFVSDYARYSVLYREGGLYFDTDVEVIRPMDDIIDKGAFLGIEKDGELISVAPGLGMGARPGMAFYREMTAFYSAWSGREGEIPDAMLVSGTTNLLLTKGFLKEDRIQNIAGIWIYPNDYFNPMDDYTGKIRVTENTRAIHYYAKSWIDGYSPLRNFLSKRFHRLKRLFDK